MSGFNHPKDILDFVAAYDGDIALVAVTDISGGTLRAKGALMAVTPSESFGYISAGCVDGDIIFQAREALKNGKTRKLVYGAGSPFKDIVLPCGGSVEVTIMPRPDKEAVGIAAKALAKRQLATLNIGDIDLTYAPNLKLRIAGRGAPFEALAELALATGFEVHGQSPDTELLRPEFSAFDHLTSPDDIPDSVDDAWTAVICLFHDHDWEPSLLLRALQGPAFYIGAMGSDRTQAQRRERLRQIGADNIDQVRGPIGLIPAMRDAQLLAVSILAEIVAAAQAKGRLG